MFTFLKKLFKPKTQSVPKPEIKNFSVTTTSAIEGTSSKKELSPEIETIVNKLQANANISNKELNQVSAYYFNTPDIPPGLFNINKELFLGMVLDIKRIDAHYDENGDISKIYIHLSDITLSNEFSMTVSVQDFHELFNSFEPKPLVKEK